MMPEAASSHPRDPPDLQGILDLADEYRAAAQVVAKTVRTGAALSRSPYRLTAIHAVELYLNVLLLHGGHDAAGVRGLQHDLASRADLASKCGLRLRCKTEAHLRTLAASREYLLSRYAPEAAADLSQLNRLAATLEEVAAKVKAIMRPGNHRPDPGDTRRLACRP